RGAAAAPRGRAGPCRGSSGTNCVALEHVAAAEPDQFAHADAACTECGDNLPRAPPSSQQLRNKARQGAARQLLGLADVLAPTPRPQRLWFGSRWTIALAIAKSKVSC